MSRVRNRSTVRIFSVIAAVGVLVSGFIATGPVDDGRAHASSAADEPPIPGDTDAGPLDHDQTDEEALLFDLTLLATSANWTIVDATQMRDLQRRSYPVVSSLRAEFPDSFAESRMPEQPGGKLTVTFAGPVPPRAYEIAEPLGDDIRLTSGAYHSEQQSIALGSQVTDAVKKLGFPAFTTNDNPVTGMVGVAAQRAPGTPQTEADALALLPQSMRNRVQISITDNVGSPLHAYGGARTISTTTGDKCTTGFAVKHLGTGTHGITTAGHCSGIDRVYQPWDGVRFEVNWQSQHIGQYGDFEWQHAPNHWHPAKFYVDTHARREVRGVINDFDFSSGDRFCAYGRTSNVPYCKVLGYTNFQATWYQSGSWYTAQRMAAMFGCSPLAGGDSGGPWYDGYTAMGLTQGCWRDELGEWYLTVSKAAWLPTALNIRVKRWGE